jgi:hypothetical protein
MIFLGGIIIHKRTAPWLMFYGVCLYYCCTSGEGIQGAGALDQEEPPSIWKWVQRLAPNCDRFDVELKLKAPTNSKKPQLASPPPSQQDIAQQSHKDHA